MKNIKQIVKQAQEKAKQTANKLLISSKVTTGFTQSNLRIMCNMYMRTISIAPNYIVQARSKIVTAIEDDIFNMLKTGKAKEEVQAFYWEVTEFQNLWSALKLTQEDLINIINSCEINLKNKGESC